MPIRAILFDVYGTLLDVHSAIAREGKELGARADGVSRLWRQKQLEYTWVWSLRGEYRSFQSLTESALDYALAAHDVDSGPLKARLLSAYRRLDAFPDVAAALAALRKHGLRLAALSNGDPDMLRRGCSRPAFATRSTPSSRSRRCRSTSPTVRSTNWGDPGPMRPHERSPSSRPMPGMPAARRRSGSAPSGSTAPGSRRNTMSRITRPSSPASAISPRTWLSPRADGCAEPRMLVSVASPAFDFPKGSHRCTHKPSS